MYRIERHILVCNRLINEGMEIYAADGKTEEKRIGVKFSLAFCGRLYERIRKPGFIRR